MFARNPFASWAHWARSSLVLALCGLPLYASCTKSEDTEPYVPAAEGAQQPDGDGDLTSEDSACARLREATEDAYDRLGCEAPALADCPGFLRPGGGSGCYEYREGSVSACEDAYEDARTCRELTPCIATAVLNTELATCELVTSEEVGAGGAGGAAAGGAGSIGSGGADLGDGGTTAITEGGSPSGAGASAGGQGGAAE